MHDDDKHDDRDPLDGDDIAVVAGATGYAGGEVIHLLVVVLSQFFIGRGLVGSGVLEKFSVTHMVLLALVFLLQLLTIRTVARLNAKLLEAPKRRRTKRTRKRSLCADPALR